MDEVSRARIRARKPGDRSHFRVDFRVVDIVEPLGCPDSATLRPPKRSLRRHHAERKKAWVKRSLRHYFLRPDEPDPGRVGLYARTPRPCSCWMCGNPRRYSNEETLQERRDLPGLDPEESG